MKGSTKLGEIAPKRWKLGEDDWFRMTTGGMVYRRFKTKENGIVHNPTFELPAYMQPEALERFNEYPVSVEASSVSMRRKGTLVVDFELSGNAKSAEVVLHYGRSDGLTLIFEDDDQPSKWEGSVSKRFKAGRHRWEIRAPQGSGFSAQGFCRLLVNADEGRFWSLESSAW